MSPPQHRLEAWTRAWPWSDPGAPPLGDWDADRSRRRLVDWLAVRAGGRSLRDLELLAERCWGVGAADRSALLRQAALALRWDGSRVAVALDCPPSEGLARWRHLVWVLPIEVLSARVCAGRCAARDTAAPQLGSPLVGGLLRERVAETHMHAMLASRSGAFWSDLLKHIAGPRYFWLEAPVEHGPFGSAHETAAALYAATILRASLAIWARNPVVTWVPPTFAADLFQLRRQVVRAIPGAPRDPHDLAEPLGGEQAFWHTLFEAVDRAEARHGPDLPVSRALHQLLGVRVRVHRWVVQEPGVRGLDWFRRSTRNAKLCPRSPSRLLRDACLESGAQAVEPRTEPPDTYAGMRRLVGELARDLRDTLDDGADLPEIGLVFHFVKTGADQPRPLPRYRMWYRRARERELALARLLRHEPQALLLVRGLDLAGGELELPLWPALPVLRRLRAASRRAAASDPERRARPFGLTVHAGEDFPHPLQGLRRVHELVEFGLLEPGDRVGHGTVLGPTPGESGGWGLVPRGELLHDLLWELGLYRSGSVEPPLAGRPLRLCHRIEQLTREGSIEALLGARAALHSVEALAAIGWLPHPVLLDDDRRGPVATRAELEIARSWTHSADVVDRHREPVPVEAEDSEPVLVGALRRHVRRQLAWLDITIETNPSSNHLIADLGDLQCHPLFSFQPPIGRESPEGPTLLASVNTDDPLTFSTTLEQEFGSVYSALLGRGVPSQEALAVLERVRDNGWRSRFTLPASRDRGVLERLARLAPPRRNSR